MSKREVYLFNAGSTLLNSLLNRRGEHLKCSSSLNRLHYKKLKDKELIDTPRRWAVQDTDAYIPMRIKGFG